MLTRRALIRTGTLAAGSLALAPAFFRSARSASGAVTPGAGPYGPLGPPDANGLMLPAGFSSRIIARANVPVGDTGYVLPIFPDGSATFSTADGGWILVVNSEVPSDGGGGASAIRFAPDGAITAAYRVLGGTSTNCAGGATPWGTWMSCEEIDGGQVWEVDPTGAKPAVARPAMGVFNHEAVAVDAGGQHLFLSEDQADGGLYRFTPDSYPDCSRGLLEVAVVADGGKVRWSRVPDPLGGTANPTRKQVPGMTQFKRGEGIYFDAGTVFLSTTSDSVVHAYDTKTETITRLYDAAATADPPLLNPDNIVVNAAGEVFVGEDDGGDDPLDLCVITPEGQIARFLKVTGVHHGIGGDVMSEVTGPSFDPSGRRLYFSSQRAYGTGVIYEVTGPFRSTRPVVAAGPAARRPRAALGLEVARRLSRSGVLARGIPVALTLDRAGTLELRATARARTRRGGPVRTVELARIKGRVGRGPARPTLVLTRRGKSILRSRRSLRVTVEVRFGGERVRRVVTVRA